MMIWEVLRVKTHSQNIRLSSQYKTDLVLLNENNTMAISIINFWGGKKKKTNLIILMFYYWHLWTMKEFPR